MSEEQIIQILKKHGLYDSSTVVNVTDGKVYVNKSLPLTVLKELTR